MNNTVTIGVNNTPAEEAFKRAAWNAGVLPAGIELLIALKMTKDKNNAGTRKGLSNYLQKRFIENPRVLKLFNDFANELAYNCLIDYFFDVASDIADNENGDIHALPEVLFKD